MATILRRLDGLPSSPFTLYHDADNVVLTEVPKTLTVAESAHIVTDYGCDIYISNLLVQECTHDHVVNHVGSFFNTYNLTVAEAYHIHRGDSTFASVQYTIGTNPLSPVLLSDLRAEGQFGERGSTQDMLLPSLSVSSRMGSQMVATLPDLGITASATLNVSMGVDATLPSLSVSSRAGIRGGTMLLPTMEIQASTETEHLCDLDRRLPGLRVSATGEETNQIGLVADLPALQISITIDAEMRAALNSTIPPPILSAVMSGQLSMNMIGLLPELRVSSGLEGTSMTVVGYIPPPVMSVGGEGIGGGVLEDTTRYDDQVLRHVR